MNQKQNAILLTHGLLDTFYAKTCHGLVRGSSRYCILAVIDYRFAGQEAGQMITGQNLDIPIFAHVEDFIRSGMVAENCIVGVAFEGGILPQEFRGELLNAASHGMNLINGLHTYLSEDTEFKAVAKKYSINLLDIRKPKPISDLKFWSGKIKEVNAVRIAVLGMDCAVGKRTTCRWIYEKCNEIGIKTEMIYTGQTGWLQGYPYGFIFDSTINDFISGELEHALWQCDQDLKPQIILIEGQSALRNPTGPCGSEIIISGMVHHCILQHQPAREYYDNQEHLGFQIPSLHSEIQLINLLGAQVIGVTLNPQGMNSADLQKYSREQESLLGIPVVEAKSSFLSVIIDQIKKVT